MMKFLMLILSVLCVNTMYSQDTSSGLSTNDEPIDFCGDMDNLKTFIGTSVKIRHNGGIYSKLNKGDYISFPNDSIKHLAGKDMWGDFYPQSGDTGVVISVSKSKYDEIIYVIKIDKYYVPIKCSYLVNISELSDDERWKLEYSKWEKERETYGKGECNFKKHNINNIYNRPGITEIDSISEDFACNLKNKGIDTIMLVKSIFHHHGPGCSVLDMVCVLWYDNDEGFLRYYSFNEEKKLIIQNQKLDWYDVIKYYRKKELNQNSEMPKGGSHLHNTVIQFYLGKEFFNCEYSWSYNKNDKKLEVTKFVEKVKKVINDR
ncbi:hypothetical protein [Plebeiibacterium marinum]|uniref:Uncharacterized protein n=1 Tax=Plebeiibacterium marinum TaxID=2992111 RepID=A0AAE3MJ84_9BACT|nr:hypothetical protein [Plebeiobacterium marinum]MCW3808067.1 hypothetical protein [Plebeiobacterium marinum]